MSVKYIPHWCTKCGTEVHYPDCAVMEVYIRCPKCSNHKPVLFLKSKLAVVEYMNRTRRDLIMDMCKLTGIKLEDLFAPVPLNPGQVFTRWIDKERKKLNKE